MVFKRALKENYHSGLAMLLQAVERCPVELWTAPNPPAGPSQDTGSEWNGVERPFWRIAFHTVYFTHLYLGQDEEAFKPPPSELAVSRRPEFERMWRAPWDLEPYELATGTGPCRPADVIAYLVFVDGLVDATVDALDLDRPSSGFSWYPKESKASHQLLNLRHLQGHVGQLSELLMLRGIDVDWV
ncbi:MAG: DinB family protein [Armatimonadetes bacterium]|nr:DinB family protein [Armatimonadota bacterium]